MKRCRFCIVPILLLAFALSAHAESTLAGATIVVYNKAVAESADLAKFYAQQRGIGRDHLVGLTCSAEEEISREEYDTTIAEPLRAVFKERHWWIERDTVEQTITGSSIHFVATIKGVPLKIRSTPSYAGDVPGPAPALNRNEASVDSEISVLAMSSRQISGPARNLYFKSFLPIAEFHDAPLLLVCRLDGPTAASVRQLVVNAMAAEKTGLVGRAYVDGAHNTAGGREMGDQWLAEIPEQLHKVGIPVVYDNDPAMFPEGYPMTDCALYYGWYAENMSGPFTQPEFRFMPGAVAIHIHSFSATTLRNPNAGWVGPFVLHGVTATMGNVYEPFLQMTSYLSVFNDHLLHGLTFAESAYASLPGLSWMSVVVGDPLYRPYAAWLQIDPSRESSKGASSWQMYHEFAAKYYPNSSTQYRSMARAAAARARNCPMIEDLGLMEARDGNYSAATTYFSQARACYSNRDDILRVVLEESDAWMKQNKPKRALDLVRGVLRVVSGAPATSLLRKVEQEASAQAPPRKP